MRAALDEARAALATDDVPIGAVVARRRRRGHRPRPQRPRGRRRPDRRTPRSSPSAPPPPPAASGGSTAARSSSPSSRARCARARSSWRGSHRLVFGAYDAKAGAVGSLWDVVRDRRLNHRPEVVPGVLAEEADALLDDFFATHRLG